MTADPRALTELLEESQDLQADALRPTHEALDELVETAHAQREDDAAANQAFHETHTKALTSSLAGTALLVSKDSPLPFRGSVLPNSAVERLWNAPNDGHKLVEPIAPLVNRTPESSRAPESFTSLQLADPISDLEACSKDAL